MIEMEEQRRKRAAERRRREILMANFQAPVGSLDDEQLFGEEPDDLPPAEPAAALAQRLADWLLPRFHADEILDLSGMLATADMALVADALWRGRHDATAPRPAPAEPGPVIANDY